MSNVVVAVPGSRSHPNAPARGVADDRVKNRRLERRARITVNRINATIGVVLIRTAEIETPLAQRGDPSRTFRLEIPEKEVPAPSSPSMGEY